MNHQSLKYFDEYADAESVKSLLNEINSQVQPEKVYSLMEFCGGHTHALFRFGLKSLLPPNIRLIHGPGCPVCVLPRGRIDSCIELLDKNPGVILCTYADLMRVPGSQRKSFIQQKAQGHDIKMVYSPFDALEIAKIHTDRNVVFLGIGFETTAPATATALKIAKTQNIQNFYVYSLHLLTPPAIQHVIDSPEARQMGTVQLDGFIGPGHVSTIIGTHPYDYFATEYHKPVVISGFAPVDMLQSLLFLIQMINRNEANVVNQYKRTVTTAGNQKAQLLLQEVFELRKSFEWRGLGRVPYSALQLSKKYSQFDAELKFSIPDIQAHDHPHCLCGSIIRGFKQPQDCQLFGKACTPDHPIGSCMVSSEGSCAAYYHYHISEDYICP